MNTIQGKRIFRDGQDQLPMLKEGEYGQHENGIWLCCTPNGHHGNLSAHEVTEHKDFAITVKPSILVSEPKCKQLWHGFLEKGVWREC